MNLQQIYNDKKQVLDSGYMDWYYALREVIENDPEYIIADDEIDELILDLMISNVLGEVIQWNEVNELIKNNKK
jgi:hypothetical protein